MTFNRVIVVQDFDITSEAHVIFALFNTSSSTKYTLFNSLYSLQTVIEGGGVYCFHVVLPYVRLSVCDILVFQYLEKAMTEFHKIWQTHWYPQDEHLW